MFASIPKMKAAQFSAELTSLRASNTNLSSVIISGHHTDREFWGINASLSEDDIERAFNQNKPLGDNVRSLYLWACYSATTDDFIKNWKSGFPNTSMLAGFDGQAPSSIHKSSGALLEDLMGKEKFFEDARDKNDVKEMFDHLNEINHVNAQICLNHETVVSRKGARTIEDDVEACGHHSRDEVKFTNLYNCYLNAEPGCETLPDTENETNPLRGAYDYFQETRHCDERLGSNGEPREANQAQVRRLLYDAQIRYTFSQIAGPQLRRLNALIDRLGLPPDLHLQQMWGLSRKEYVDKIIAMKTAYLALADRTKDQEGHIKDANVLAFGYNLAELDKFNDGECTPLEWLEEDPHAQDSSCGIVKGMDAAMGNAKALVASYGSN